MERKAERYSRRLSIDSTTGVYTFQPVNVDGNREASVSDDIEASFGKSRH